MLLSRTQRIRLSVSPAAALLLLSIGAAADPARSAEIPPVLVASEVLSADEHRGPHHQVAEEVANDGYMNTYRIVSDFGELDAYGRTMLTVRLQEIRALAELSELSDSKVFVDALARAGLSQIEAIGEFAKRPVKTIKGIPDGARRWLERTERTVKEGAAAVKKEVADAKAKSKQAKGTEKGQGEKTLSKEEMEELAKKGAAAGTAYADKYFAVNTAQLDWARRLRVDPYTSNGVMRKALYEVAEVAAAGSFIANRTLPRIRGVDILSEVTDLVWSTDPRELRDRNVKMLLDGGADPARVEAFFASPWYSPTLQTALVSAIAGFDGVEGRGLMIERAATAQSEEEAVFLVDGARMLAAFHRTVSPIERLVGDLWLPGAVSTDRRLVYLLPVDHISFTAEVEGVESHLAVIVARSGAPKRELWLRGTASARYRKEAEARGWAVQEEAGETP